MTQEQPKFKNRPFTFRAWSFKPFDPFQRYPEGKMIHEWFSRHDSADWMIQDDISLPELAEVDDEDHIMQFTGLSDRQGKPLFEGDVVWLEPQEPRQDGPGEGLYDIVFCWGCFCLQSRTAGDQVFPLFAYGSWDDKERDFELDIVGHVHEHQDLLDQRATALQGPAVPLK